MLPSVPPPSPTPPADDPHALLAASDAARARSAPREGAALARAAAQLAEGRGDSHLAGEALALLALHQVRLGELEAAVSSGQQALAHFAHGKPSAAHARARCTLSLAYERTGLHTLAVSHAAAALALARELGDLAAECWALIRLGTAADEGEEQHGLELLEQALDLARQLPANANTVDSEALFTALNNLSRRWVVEADRQAANDTQARAALLAALPLAEEAAQRSWPGLAAATAAANLGGVHRRLGHAPQARAHFSRALAEAEKRGYAGLAATVRLALASLDFETEPHAAHQQALAALLDAHAAAVDPDLALQARRTLVQGCRAQGDLAAALRHMERLHTEVLAAQARRSDLQTRLLFNHAELHQARHAAERARLAAEVERLRADAEQQTARRLTLDRDLLEREVAARTFELQQATSAAQAASRAKSTFLSIVSHELRTPLNGLIGMLDLARRRAADERQAHQLHMASAAARQLSGLIVKILDYVAADTRTPSQLSDWDLRSWLAAALQARHEAADSKGLRLVVDCATAVPERVRADRSRLGQILEALLDNALKFSSPGAVRVEAGWSTGAQGQPQLLLSVSDSGPGLAPELLQRLFRPFELGDASDSRAEGGLGLGLALAQRLAQSLGGELGVDSHPPAGSRFWVRIPVAVAEAVS